MHFCLTGVIFHEISPVKQKCIVCRETKTGKRIFGIVDVRFFASQTPCLSTNQRPQSTEEIVVVVVYFQPCGYKTE